VTYRRTNTAPSEGQNIFPKVLQPRVFRKRFYILCFGSIFTERNICQEIICSGAACVDFDRSFGCYDSKLDLHKPCSETV